MSQHGPFIGISRRHFEADRVLIVVVRHGRPTLEQTQKLLETLTQLLDDATRARPVAVVWDLLDLVPEDTDHVPRELVTSLRDYIKLCAAHFAAKARLHILICEDDEVYEFVRRMIKNVGGLASGVQRCPNQDDALDLARLVLKAQREQYLAQLEHREPRTGAELIEDRDDEPGDEQLLARRRERPRAARAKPEPEPEPAPPAAPPRARKLRVAPEPEPEPEPPKPRAPKPRRAEPEEEEPESRPRRAVPARGAGRL